MPKLNELQDRPDGIVLPNQLIAIADPATGEMYKLPLNIVLGITDITKPDPAAQILRFWKGPDDYFDIDFTGASPGGGGGGAASRFGIEDNTTDVNRNVNMSLHNLKVLNAGIFELQSGDINGVFTDVTGNQSGILKLTTDAGDGNFSAIYMDSSYGMSIGASIGLMTASVLTDEAGVYITQVIADPTHNAALQQRNKFVFANTAAANNAEVTKTIAATRAEDNFTDDAAAAAAGIPVGAFYHTAGVVKMRLV